MTSTKPSCRRPIPAQKICGSWVPGAIFSHIMPHGYLKNYQSYIKKLLEKREIDLFGSKKWIFKIVQKFPFSNGKRSSQPKYHNPRWKTVINSLKTKIYYCYIRKKTQKNINCKKKPQKKPCFFLMSQGAFNPKTRFLGQNVWPVACSRRDRHTDRQTLSWLILFLFHLCTFRTLS